MKKLMLAVCIALIGMWSVASFAATTPRIGVVNMQTIFRDSPQVKKINASLKRQFAGRKDSIVKMGKQLQSALQNYQKNKAVMSSKDLTALQSKITKQEMQLRAAQAKFQKELFEAQNKQMTAFMNKVRGVVKTVAAQKNLSMVLPKNSVLYSDNNLDLTKQVLSKLQ